MTDNSKTKKARTKAKAPSEKLRSSALPTPPKRTAAKTHKVTVDEESIQAFFEKAAAGDEYHDRQAAEAAIHRPTPKIGITDLEPELELGRRLQEAREAAKLTQGELAERTKQADSEGKGISRAVLSLYEIGKNRPSPRELRMLCEVLRVSPNKLIYGDEDPFSDRFEWARYKGFATSDPEFYALLVYAFSKQHPHNRISIMQLMNSLLLGWDKNWWNTGAHAGEANQQLLDMADKLKALLTKRKETSTQKK